MNKNVISIAIFLSSSLILVSCFNKIFYSNSENYFPKNKNYCMHFESKSGNEKHQKHEVSIMLSRGKFNFYNKKYHKITFVNFDRYLSDNYWSDFICVKNDTVFLANAIIDTISGKYKACHESVFIVTNCFENRNYISTSIFGCGISYYDKIFDEKNHDSSIVYKIHYDISGAPYISKIEISKKLFFIKFDYFNGETTSTYGRYW